MRKYTKFDEIVAGLQRTLNPDKSFDGHPNIANEDKNLSLKDKVLSTQLMRVNHAGEVAAQALYLGQSLAAHNVDTKSDMKHSADEELVHLSWCAKRLDELESKPSKLTPVWFVGCLTIGFIAGKYGDETSYSFTAETERQVAEHLSDHLNRLPKNDLRSCELLKKMLADEIMHMDFANKKSDQILDRNQLFK